MENEQADAGRDCRTRLVRPKFSGAYEDREIFIFPVQLTTSRIGNCTRLIHTLLYVMTIYYFYSIRIGLVQCRVQGVLVACSAVAYEVKYTGLKYP